MERKSDPKYLVNMILAGVRVPVLHAAYGDHIDRETGDYWTDYGKVIIARDVFNEKIAPKLLHDDHPYVRAGRNNPRRKITFEYELEDGSTDSDCLDVAEVWTAEQFPREPDSPITMMLGVNQIYYGKKRVTMNDVEV